MKRTFRLAVLAVLAVGAGVVIWISQRPDGLASQGPAANADSVWYHASDVALLAKTGRPQLVEFFHPG